MSATDETRDDLRGDDVPEPPKNPLWTGGRVGTHRKQKGGLITWAIEETANPDAWIEADNADCVNLESVR